MKIVVAIDGTMLPPCGRPPDLGREYMIIARLADALSKLAAFDELVVTCCDGCQASIEAPADTAEAASSPIPPSLTERAAGPLNCLLLADELRSRLPGRKVVTLVTAIIVAPDNEAHADPAQSHQSAHNKPEHSRIGEHDQHAVRNGRNGQKQLLASFQRHAVVDLATIARLVDTGVIVIACVSGRGVPDDSELAAALLGSGLNADALVLATNLTPAVAVDRGRSCSRDIRCASPQHLRASTFAAGSMPPQVEAACRFVESGGRWCAIGASDQLAAVIASGAGTRVVAGPCPITYHARRTTTLPH